MPTTDLNACGKNYELVQKGFIEFLLLNDKGVLMLMLEAKAEEKHPLLGKEQEWQYSRSQNCRFVILSNGRKSEAIRNALWM